MFIIVYLFVVFFLFLLSLVDAFNRRKHTKPIVSCLPSVLSEAPQAAPSYPRLPVEPLHP